MEKLEMKDIEKVISILNGWNDFRVGDDGRVYGWHVDPCSLEEEYTGKTECIDTDCQTCHFGVAREYVFENTACASVREYMSRMSDVQKVEFVDGLNKAFGGGFEW